MNETLPTEILLPGCHGWNVTNWRPTLRVPWMKHYQPTSYSQGPMVETLTTDVLLQGSHEWNITNWRPTPSVPWMKHYQLNSYSQPVLIRCDKCRSALSWHMLNTYLLWIPPWAETKFASPNHTETIIYPPFISIQMIQIRFNISFSLIAILLFITFINIFSSQFTLDWKPLNVKCLNTIEV